MKTLEFDIESVKEHLDRTITFWRNSKESYSVYYVDAYQSLRMSLFGELLKGEDNARDRQE